MNINELKAKLLPSVQNLVPNIDEVANYISANNYLFEANYFLKYYLNRSWSISPNFYKPITDWKRVCDKWANIDKNQVRAHYLDNQNNKHLSRPLCKSLQSTLFDNLEF